ncbi:hypothetical protein WJX72_006388 [[Myrmecia] bisecta]|uniref:SET domain-containing protein n=1 Tax=[Myrmecia] bisecta TaxID=41462 RepID=A0AAW1Q9A9_9CHLO
METAAEPAPAVVGSMETKGAPKAKRRKVSGAKPKAPVERTVPALSGSVAAFMQCLQANQEPYAQGPWRREPWPVRPYESIAAYQVAPDAGEAADHAALLAKLRTSKACGPGCPSTVSFPLDLASAVNGVVVDAVPQALQLGLDVVERPAWGMDCFTHRAIFDALGQCSELVPADALAEESVRIRHDFIEHTLLPAINRQAEAGWDICRAIQEERFYFRLHPKGQGVMCKREGGLPAGTFVAEYLGELYSPWRWFEKQDALKKRNPHMGLPDFYNITLERPKDDEAGYDVVFVEAAQKASFASRLSHSCTPNCHTMSLAVDGRLTIGIFTSRDVAVGEELSWDYACVTESEREYRSAICMCGTRSCRGSFLYYANSSSFQAVMSKRHNFLDRNALVVRASCEEPTEADWERLKAHGIGRSILGANPDAQISEGWPPLPWMVKWASFILEFVELERAELPGALVEKAELGYTLEGAAVEADGVRDNRVQNLAITVDKAKFFMRHQTAQMQVAPLHVLTDAEVVEFLWSGAQSIGRRSAMLALQHISPAPAASGKQRKPANADAPNGLAAKGAAEIQALLKSARPADAAAARQLLCTLRSTLLQQGPAHAAMCDLLALYAHTQLFFSPSKFKPLTSAEATKGKGAAKKAPKAKAEAAGKPYRPAYLWGQLTAWFKQTVYDPTASLSADRRGTVSLPDPESAYCPATTSGKYLTGGERKALLDMLTRTPFVMWPTSTLWSFKNAAKVYGSPMLDAALRCSRAGTTLSAGDATWDALLTELRSAS